MFDPTQMARHRERARKIRGEWLMMVREGTVTIDQLLSMYATERALGPIRLTQLLASQPGVGMETARKQVEKWRWMVARRYPKSRVYKVPEHPTVRHLMDGRNGPLFLEFWRQATTKLPLAPWDGFPHTVEPQAPAAAVDDGWDF